MLSTSYKQPVNSPLKHGERIVVNGNLQPYAAAYVADCVYLTQEARWAIILHWPNAPGTGSKTSRVYDTDEDKDWYRYASSN